MESTKEDELMIETRKRVAKQRVRSGELVQGAVFCLLNAREHFHGAKILFEANQDHSAFPLMINGIEELGKLKSFAEILLNWREPHRAEEFRKTQTHHEKKLSSALGVISDIVKRGEAKFKIKIGSLDLDGEDLISHVQKLFSPSAASLYHKMRLSRSYVHFDGTRAKSPFHGFDEFAASTAKTINALLMGSLEILLKLSDKVLPIYMEPIRECFVCRDEEKVSAMKEEIHRRVERTIPAFRMVFDEYIKETTGRSSSEWERENLKIPVPSGENAIVPLLKKVAAKIVDRGEIPTEYVYPPLKDWAKDYYKAKHLEFEAGMQKNQDKASDEKEG